MGPSEDVFPIENRDIPASYVSLPEGKTHSDLKLYDWIILRNIWDWKMGVEPKIGGKPPKWMVYFMENPIKMNGFGGSIIFGNTHMSIE